MEIKQPDWEKNLTDFIQDDFDGRMWFDDMVKRMLEGSITVTAYEDHLRHESETVNEEDFEAGREVGYDDGYSDGYDAWKEEQFIEGYRAGHDDGKNGKPNPYD